MSGGNHKGGKGGAHRGWWVSATNAKAQVPYKSKSSAKSVAKNVQGGKVSRGGGCWATMLLLPLSLLSVLYAVASVWPS